jgi:chromosome segregation ATPase
MTDILDQLRAAFDNDSVPRKNIALRKAHDEIERLTEAKMLADAEAREQITVLRAENERLLKLFQIDGEQHAAAVKAARHEQDARLAVYQAEIEQLKIDVEHWKCEDANGTALVLHLSAEVEQLTTENKNLREQIATCRELREYDRKKIEQLRAEIKLVSK